MYAAAPEVGKQIATQEYEPQDDSEEEDDVPLIQLSNKKTPAPDAPDRGKSPGSEQPSSNLEAGEKQKPQQDKPATADPVNLPQSVTSSAKEPVPATLQHITPRNLRSALKKTSSVFPPESPAEVHSLALLDASYA